MSKNDIFYKVLFAIGLALLPLVIFANYFIEEKWALGLFIGAVLLVKIWLELFKDKYNFQHAIISAILSVLTFGVLLILFAVNDYINVAFVVVTLVFVVLYNVLWLLCFKKQLPEFVAAVDFCFMLFECIALGCLVVVAYFSLPVIIGMFALLLTAVVSVGYKIYMLVKNLIDKKSTKL